MLFVKRLLVIATLTGLFYLPAASTAADAPLRLSLQDALQTAIEKNFDVRVQKETRKQADFNLKGAYGAYDPYLTLDWSTSVNRQPTTSVLQAGAGANLYQNRQDQYNLGVNQNTPWGQNFSLAWDNTRQKSNSSFMTLNPSYQSFGTLSTRLPLLQNFGYRVANRTVLKAKLDKAIADSSYMQNVRDVLFSVENDYWNFVYAIRNLDVKKRALQLAKQFQEETAKKIKVGVLAPIEQIAADAQVASREQEIIAAVQSVGDSEDALKLALGITRDDKEWSESIVPTDEPVISAGDYEESQLLKKAHSQRPELARMEKQVKKDKLDTHWAHNQMLPKLDFNASVTYRGSAGYYKNPYTGAVVNDKFSKAWEQITGRDYKSYSVGVNFAIPIGNRAARAGYQVYRLNQNADEIALQKQELTIANEVRSALRNLRATQKRVSAAELTLKLQQEKLDAEKKKFENGLSTSFNVLSYQNDLATAESGLLRARIDASLASAALDKAVGTYLKARGIEIG